MFPKKNIANECQITQFKILLQDLIFSMLQRLKFDFNLVYLMVSSLDHQSIRRTDLTRCLHTNLALPEHRKLLDLGPCLDIPNNMIEQ